MSDPWREPLGLDGRREADRLRAAGLAEGAAGDLNVLEAAMLLEMVVLALGGIRAEGLVSVDDDGRVRENPSVSVLAYAAQALRERLEVLGRRSLRR